ncbi:MAG: ATP-binding protein [Clostridia bacterium]|nr:ATP-binding protein [Clostridia bacterium]
MINKLDLLAQIKSVLVFRGVVNAPVMKALVSFLECEETGAVAVEKYVDFVSALYEYGTSFTDYLLDAAVTDENAYVKMVANGKEVPEAIADCAENELSILGELSELDCKTLQSLTAYEGKLPAYEITDIDFAECYRKRIADISKNGYGIYSKYVMFRVVDGAIVPVTSPDHISIMSLYGYEKEREKLIVNTKALLEGKPAANTLLYGDAGTGKSSSVKAVTNMLAPEGLRLIELKKNQLWEIPAVLEQLRDNPLKFIIFIDDLSFNKDDDNFSGLKAILEGSASAKSSNTVIYATSNRRHLVKENFSDREGDDVHRNDTMQEMLSLSNRFGLTILFQRPNNDLYQRIVSGLAEAKGITIPENELYVKASAFAIRHGGRSPRVAEQFINSLLVEK